MIADDSIVELVTGQLAKMGFYGHDDVAIVGLANFPTLLKKHLPMLCIGFEANLALETCVQLILAQLKGVKTSELTILPALYEHDSANPWRFNEVRWLASCRQLIPENFGSISFDFQQNLF